ncbi:MFS transporter [Rouxiella badensis]|nr:MFS transporter [Rouxiella badensis]
MMVFVVGPWSFYSIRLLLGIAEAGFFPGVIYFLSIWFPVQFRTRVLAWFTVATPISFLVGGPLSTSLLQLHGFLGMDGWQWMFLIEGVPACLLGFVALRRLADRPEQANWLTEKEKVTFSRMMQIGGRAVAKPTFPFGLERRPRVVAQRHYLQLHLGHLRGRHLVTADAQGRRH